MIGVGVRDLFEKGKGAPAFIAVEKDETGKAWDTVTAMAKAIGATKAGALVSSFAEETEIDHFAEQAAGYPVFEKLMKEALSHPINEVEKRIKDSFT